MQPLATDRPARRSTGFVPQDVAAERRPDGALLLTSRVPLPPAAPNSGAWLRHWASAAPDRTFIAERSGGGWRTHGYADVLARVEAIAAALLARDLGPERPRVVLSGNGVDHAPLLRPGTPARS
jgi:feruloyl-CoA synthase